jgi:hypothetical protein
MSSHSEFYEMMMMMMMLMMMMMMMMMEARSDTDVTEFKESQGRVRRKSRRIREVSKS